MNLPITPFSMFLVRRRVDHAITGSSAHVNTIGRSTNRLRAVSLAALPYAPRSQTRQCTQIRLTIPLRGPLEHRINGLRRAAKQTRRKDNTWHMNIAHSKGSRR
jgi:hypothetical protein